MALASRSRIIPTKRPLLPPRHVPSCSSLNPSSKPADIQIGRPVFSSLPASHESNVSDNVEKDQEQAEKGQTATVEFDFSQAPQPFLSPDVWSKARRWYDTQGEQSSRDAEREERRKEREAEYGGLAVQGRTARRKRR